MNKIEELLAVTKDFTENERQELIKKIREQGESTAERKYEVYTHYCHGSSSYHMRKYRHWAKTLKAVDDSQTNGYAFVGDFLKVEQEDRVKVGSYIVEFVGCERMSYKLFLVKEEEFELLAEGQKSEVVTFIQKAKKLTGL